MGHRPRPVRLALALALAATAPLALASAAPAQEPAVLDPALSVRTVASGLSSPTALAFLGTDDFLVIEKGSGRVKRVRDGVVSEPVLDLPVNSSGERGLLGIALHPRFRTNHFVYLFWSESRIGTDTGTLDGVRLMGNRVDRFEWTGGALEYDRPIIQFRAYQADQGQPLRANHNGGVLRFGPDGKLYVIVGDTGRRGQTQNLADGPVAAGTPDDQFGGPEIDDMHRTGVIMRLNPDGSAPRDNPFFRRGRSVGGEVGVNLQKLYAYGIRNSFGMDFDPVSGDLWEQENGDDTFSELNRVMPGMNGGWVQVMGPLSRIAEYKAIETDPTVPQPQAGNGYFGLQQIRWLPTNIADTAQQAQERMVMLPGAEYSDPELSWKFEVAPAGIGFLRSPRLGAEYRRDLFLGGSRDVLEGGHIFRVELAPGRARVAVEDPRLEDLVADNTEKWTITESESLLFGRNFGVATDIRTSPDGALYVVSLSKGSVYAIEPAPPA